MTREELLMALDPGGDHERMGKLIDEYMRQDRRRSALYLVAAARQCDEQDAHSFGYLCNAGSVLRECAEDILKGVHAEETP